MQATLHAFTELLLYLMQSRFTFEAHIKTGNVGLRQTQRLNTFWLTWLSLPYHQIQIYTISVYTKIALSSHTQTSALKPRFSIETEGEVIEERDGEEEGMQEAKKSEK